MAIQEAKLITIASVKGGTGKTTTALNLAGTYSLMEKKVLILDFDLFSGGIALALNVEIEKDLYKLAYDMSVNEYKNINDYILKYNEFIDIIPDLFFTVLFKIFNLKLYFILFFKFITFSFVLSFL